MMKSVFWNKVLIIFTFTCILSCTYDSNIDISDNKVDEAFTKSLNKEKTMEGLVVFKQGTSELSKREIRYKYIKTGLLLGWNSCEFGLVSQPRTELGSETNNKDDGNDTNDPNDDTGSSNEVNNVEVWEIDLEIYYAGDPTVLIATENEDIERFIAYANCKDYKVK